MKSILTSIIRASVLAGLFLGSSAVAATQAMLAPRSIYQIGGKWDNDSGQVTELATLRGHPVVLAMFFTRCGYACPLTVAMMQQIREALPSSARARTKFVLVSFDSEGDSPAVLREYRRQNHLDPGGWELFDGTASAVRALAMVLGVQYAQSSVGQFSHSNLVTVLDPEGLITFQGAPSAPGLIALAQAAIGR